MTGGMVKIAVYGDDSDLDYVPQDTAAQYRLNALLDEIFGDWEQAALNSQSWSEAGAVYIRR
mgnify:CR=1 FL=1